jgi:hypothetical protein
MKKSFPNSSSSLQFLSDRSNMNHQIDEGDIMEIMRKVRYHATVVKNVQPDDPPYGANPDALLVELNTEDGQYHSISLSMNAAGQLLQQLSEALEKAEA